MKPEIEKLFKKYELTGNDSFKHKHYEIITRQGIDKIQAKERIAISYEAVKVEPEFCVIKAKATKGAASIETFGSAKYGGKVNKDDKWVDVGNSTTWYIAEMAEKRAMSRAVLKLTGFYELGVFGEDESEDFKRQSFKESAEPKKVEIKPVEPKKDMLDITSMESIKKAISDCNTIADVKKMWDNNLELQTGSKSFVKLIVDRKKILKDNGINK